MLTKNALGYILADFFTNSSGRIVREMYTLCRWAHLIKIQMETLELILVAFDLHIFETDACKKAAPKKVSFRLSVKPKKSPPPKKKKILIFFLATDLKSAILVQNKNSGLEIKREY
jgi:hypothetical protein